MATSPLKAAFAGLPTADLLDQMFISLFGYTQAQVDELRATEAGAAGFQYWADEIANNSDMININTLAIALLNGAVAAEAAGNGTDGTKAAELVAADVAAYKAYAGETETPVETDGQTVYLTANQDILVGTDGNDTFYAYASQNVNGATTNTLSTGDMIDGGKGSSDKIISSMINDETVNNSANFAPMPIINNVEEIRVQALENGVNATSTNDVVILDADQITGETKYASDSSRADLVITNVDITSTQITNDIKLEMKDTQQNSDFAVYFDQTSLKANPDKVVSSA